MDTLKELVRTGDAEGTVARVQQLLNEGQEAEPILKNGLIPAMDEVGELFQKGEYYLPEMLIAARAMKRGLEVLKPRLVATGVEPAGKVVVGTVKGDLHDIGKNLVAMALEGAGLEVIDLGVDVPPDKFIESIREHEPVAIGISALLTTTMIAMGDTIRAIEESGERGKVKIMVGGAPVTAEFAVEVGADFYGDDPAAGKTYVTGLLA
jgi:5-methyltetrahydrofolate--homocysteine methyltransferase